MSQDLTNLAAQLREQMRRVENDLDTILDGTGKVRSTSVAGTSPHGHGGGAEGGPLRAAKVEDYLDLKAQPAAPGVPSAGYVRLFGLAADKDLYQKDDAGGEVNLSSGAGGTLTVQEEDGTPIDTAVTIIRFPNGSLTDNGVGDISVAFAGGGDVATDAIWDAAGDTVYGTGANTAVKLAGNITTTKKFLRQTGDGAASAAPAWDTVLAADVVATAMKQSVILKGWQPTSTTGCAVVAKTEIGATTKHDENTLAFDPTTAESAFLSYPMPDNWDGGTVTFYVWWFAKTGAGAGLGVAWTIKGTCYESIQAIDSVFGTGVTVTHEPASPANETWYATADSAALTLAGAEAGERQRVHLVITRTVSDAADDWAADVELGDVVMEYGIASLSS